VCDVQQASINIADGVAPRGARDIGGISLPVFCSVRRFCDAIQILFVLINLFFLGYGSSCKPSQKELSIAKNAGVYPYCAKSVSFFIHNESIGIYPITI
jgi:hypothetical protein